MLTKNKLIISLTDDQHVAVYDTKSNEIEKKIPVPVGPRGLWRLNHNQALLACYRQIVKIDIQTGAFERFAGCQNHPHDFISSKLVGVPPTGVYNIEKQKFEFEIFPPDVNPACDITSEVHTSLSADTFTTMTQFLNGIEPGFRGDHVVLDGEIQPHPRYFAWRRPHHILRSQLTGYDYVCDSMSGEIMNLTLGTPHPITNQYLQGLVEHRETETFWALGSSQLMRKRATAELLEIDPNSMTVIREVKLPTQGYAYGIG